jgi:hypothetical protein
VVGEGWGTSERTGPGTRRRRSGRRGAGRRGRRAAARGGGGAAPWPGRWGAQAAR